MIPFASATRTHAGDRIARPLSEVQADVIDTVLHSLLGVHIRPCADVFGVVHLYPGGPVSTRDEVRALRAIRAVTDSPLAWHPAKPEVIRAVIR